MDFPTPPFPLTTPITFFIELPLCGLAINDCGCAPEQFELQEEQS
jgi:hypothetical protein